MNCIINSYLLLFILFFIIFFQYIRIKYHNIKLYYLYYFYLFKNVYFSTYFKYWNSRKLSTNKFICNYMFVNFQIKVHVSPFCFLPIFGAFAWRANLMASSKTFFNPSWVKALHSKYLALCSSSIICLATYFLMGAFFGSLIFSWYSYLKSILLPTNIFID